MLQLSQATAGSCQEDALTAQSPSAQHVAKVVSHSKLPMMSLFQFHMVPLLVITVWLVLFSL